jgi:hypothetical protein
LSRGNLRLFQKFMQALLLSPRAYFFCRPERSEGSLGTGVPREDIPGRRPERSERCLANARQDKKDARQDGVGNFFEQPQRQLRPFQETCSRPFILGVQGYAHNEKNECKNKSRLLVENRSDFRQVA